VIACFTEGSPVPIPVPVSVDVGVGDALRAIGEIRARRRDVEESVWSDLRHTLEAVSTAIRALDELYLDLLVELEDVVRGSDGELDVERAREIAHQAHKYLHDRNLLSQLQELQGEIQAAAFHPKLRYRKFRGIRYRGTASNLRSLDNRLSEYISRLKALQSEETETRTAPDGDIRWDLRTVIDYMEDSIKRGTLDGEYLAEMIEEAIRNFDGNLSETIFNLVGSTRVQLVLARL
jgi:hypothetical protein